MGFLTAENFLKLMVLLAILMISLRPLSIVYLHQFHSYPLLGDLPCISLVAYGPVSCSDRLLSLCQLVLSGEQLYRSGRGHGCSVVDARGDGRRSCALTNDEFVTTSNRHQESQKRRVPRLPEPESVCLTREMHVS